MARAALITPLAIALALAAGCQDRSISLDPATGLEYRDIRQGDGLRVAEGTPIEAHYIVSLADGTVVVDTYATGDPHRWTVGDGTVILGVDRGVRGMRAGGLRIIEVPARAAYGKTGVGGKVPPDSTLTVRVELITARSG